ncbi:hypothetical protein FPV67DRAFT_1521642 [Lyophyllum atratum]|nr:hypothetical protein FPV67DRAFT_1521642 [Lyophyllum atratum]
MPLFDHASNFNIYGGTFNDFQGHPATLERMKEILEDLERQKVMAWLSRMDFLAKQSDILHTADPGTGEWFLESAAFRAWQDGTDSQALWCPGIPGAGKTVLVSLIINQLCALQHREPVGTIGVAWIYYNYKDQSYQTPDAIHLSLIRQLAGFSKEWYDHLKSLYDRDPNSRPSARQLIPDAHTWIRDFKKAFIIIDALDECAASDRRTVLNILSGLRRSGANILITSRENVGEDLGYSDLANAQRIDILASSSDITAYVNAHLETRLARIIKKMPSLRDEILRVIVGACKGMFLLATFQMESLRDMHNVGEVQDALKFLPKTFPDIYNDAMNRIESGSNRSKKLALRLLSFLIYAHRPLKLRELQHFLVVEPGHTDFHQEYVTDKEVLLSICAGLVVFDDKTEIARLVHLTAQEYFDTIRASKFSKGDQDMGCACLIYLSFDFFKNTANLSQSYLKRYALLDYVAHYWHLHVVGHQEALETHLSALFSNGALLQAYSHFMRVSRRDYFSHESLEHRQLKHTGLHATAAVGLLSIARSSIAEGADVNLKDFTGRSPLMYSLQGGHMELVDLLLSNGADPNTQDGDGITALVTVSVKGCETMARLLLEKGADLHARGRHGETPLYAASKQGHEAVARLLLMNGADVDAWQCHGETPLFMASKRGHEAVARLLLINGANVDALDAYRCTPLFAATACGHEHLVKLLLESGGHVSKAGPARPAEVPTVTKVNDDGDEGPTDGLREAPERAPLAKNLKAVIARLNLIFKKRSEYKRILSCRGSAAQRLLEIFQTLLDVPGLNPKFRGNLRL